MDDAKSRALKTLSDDFQALIPITAEEYQDLLDSGLKIVSVGPCEHLCNQIQGGPSLSWKERSAFLKSCRLFLIRREGTSCSLVAMCEACYNEYLRDGSLFRASDFNLFNN
jgi:hypothetical protein